MTLTNVRAVIRHRLALFEPAEIWRHRVAIAALCCDVLVAYVVVGGTLLAGLAALRALQAFGLIEPWWIVLAALFCLGAQVALVAFGSVYFVRRHL